jgi:hypothetical protein
LSYSCGWVKTEKGGIGSQCRDQVHLVCEETTISSSLKHLQIMQRDSGLRFHVLEGNAFPFPGFF